MLVTSNSILFLSPSLSSYGINIVAITEMYPAGVMMQMKSLRVSRYLGYTNSHQIHLAGVIKYLQLVRLRLP